MLQILQMLSFQNPCSKRSFMKIRPRSDSFKHEEPKKPKNKEYNDGQPTWDCWMCKMNSMIWKLRLETWTLEHVQEINKKGYKALMPLKQKSSQLFRHLYILINNNHIWVIQVSHQRLPPKKILETATIRRGLLIQRSSKPYTSLNVVKKIREWEAEALL